MRDVYKLGTVMERFSVLPPGQRFTLWSTLGDAHVERARSMPSNAVDRLVASWVDLVKLRREGPSTGRPPSTLEDMVSSQPVSVRRLALRSMIWSDVRAVIDCQDLPRVQRVEGRPPPTSVALRLDDACRAFRAVEDGWWRGALRVEQDKADARHAQRGRWKNGH